MILGLVLALPATGWAWEHQGIAWPDVPIAWEVSDDTVPGLPAGYTADAIAQAFDPRPPDPPGGIRVCAAEPPARAAIQARSSSCRALPDSPHDRYTNAAPHGPTSWGIVGSMSSIVYSPRAPSSSVVASLKSHVHLR